MCARICDRRPCRCAARSIDGGARPGAGAARQPPAPHAHAEPAIAAAAAVRERAAIQAAAGAAGTAAGDTSGLAPAAAQGGRFSRQHRHFQRRPQRRRRALSRAHGFLCRSRGDAAPPDAALCRSRLYQFGRRHPLAESDQRHGRNRHHRGETRDDRGHRRRPAASQLHRGPAAPRGGTAARCRAAPRAGADPARGPAYRAHQCPARSCRFGAARQSRCRPPGPGRGAALAGRDAELRQRPRAERRFRGGATHPHRPRPHRLWRSFDLQLPEDGRPQGLRVRHRRAGDRLRHQIPSRRRAHRCGRGRGALQCHRCRGADIVHRGRRHAAGLSHARANLASLAR